MAPLPPTLYGQVLEWVTQQQQLELAGEPAAMTAAQRKALMELHRLVKPAEVEPPLGAGIDWISRLNLYRQANPTTMGIKYRDEPVGEPPAPLRWIVYCRVAECPDEFPGPAGGLDPAAGLPPTFARKQSAKSYAAKCAYEWLLARRGPRPAFHGQQAADGHAEKAPGQQQQQRPPAAPNGGASVPPPGAGDGQASKQVTALCGELGLPPPQYHIDRVGGAYGGFASFGGIARHRFAPGGLGHVSQALSKIVAKEMIAEEVTKALLQMKEHRDRQSAGIRESNLPPGEVVEM